MYGENNQSDIPIMKNGLFQIIRMEESIRPKQVKRACVSREANMSLQILFPFVKLAHNFDVLIHHKFYVNCFSKIIK